MPPPETVPSEPIAEFSTTAHSVKMAALFRQCTPAPWFDAFCDDDPLAENVHLEKEEESAAQ